MVLSILIFLGPVELLPNLNGKVFLDFLPNHLLNYFDASTGTKTKHVVHVRWHISQDLLDYLNNTFPDL